MSAAARSSGASPRQVRGRGPLQRGAQPGVVDRRGDQLGAGGRERQHLGQQPVQVQHLDAAVAQRLGERVVLLLRAVDPGDAVEEQLVVVARGQPPQLGPGPVQQHGAQPADLAGGAHERRVGRTGSWAEAGTAAVPPPVSPRNRWIVCRRRPAAQPATRPEVPRGPVRPDRQGGRRHRRHPRHRPDDGPRPAAGRRPRLHQLAQGRGRGRRRRRALAVRARSSRSPPTSPREEECVRLAAAVGEREDELHILVNNAGATWGAPSWRTFPVSAWDKVLDLNLKSPFFLTRAFLPLLEEAGTDDDPARVVNVGSIDGLHVPPMHTYSYSSSKAALHHLTRVLAKELGPRRITVNAVAPGPFESKMMAATLDAFGKEIAARVAAGPDRPPRRHGRRRRLPVQPGRLLRDRLGHRRGRRHRHHPLSARRRRQDMGRACGAGLRRGRRPRPGRGASRPAPPGAASRPARPARGPPATTRARRRGRRGARRSGRAARRRRPGVSDGVPSTACRPR